MSREKRFTEIFKTNEFRSKESRSGAGSEITQTRILVEQLKWLFVYLGVRSVADAPCGDCNWIQVLFPCMEVNSIDYVGLDIVEELIVLNKSKYKGSISFQKRDIVVDPLPYVDLILCRDCLVHLSYDSAHSFLRNFVRSGSKYLLTTTFTHRPNNIDLEDGSNWYPIILTKAPFNLPQPRIIINENCTELTNRYMDKSLGLWTREDLLSVEIK